MAEIEIIVETFRHEGESSKSDIRLRPLPGQGFSPDVRVAYSMDMRHARRVGTLIKLWVTPVHSHKRAMYLRAGNNDPGKVVSLEEADAFIEKQFGET